MAEQKSPWDDFLSGEFFEKLKKKRQEAAKGGSGGAGGDGSGKGPGKSILSTRAKIIIGVVVLVLAVIILSASWLSTFYTDYLWYNEVGQTGVFWKVITTKIWVFFLFGTVFFLIFYLNIYLARRLTPKYELVEKGNALEQGLSDFRNKAGKWLGRGLLAGSLLLSILVGWAAGHQWEKVLKFFTYTGFGKTDPIFDKDVGFYLFKLPFLEYVFGWLMAVLIATLVITAAVHFLYGAINFNRKNQRFAGHAKAHLSVLAGLILLTQAYRFRLQMFTTLYHTSGNFTGAHYSDVHALIPALYILIGVSVICAGLFIANIWFKGWKLPAVGLITIVVVSVLAGALYPYIIQNYLVKPKELSREYEYLGHNIEYTQDAYGVQNEGEDADVDWRRVPGGPGPRLRRHPRQRGHRAQHPPVGPRRDAARAQPAPGPAADLQLHRHRRRPLHRGGRPLQPDAGLRAGIHTRAAARVRPLLAERAPLLHPRLRSLHGSPQRLHPGGQPAAGDPGHPPDFRAGPGRRDRTAGALLQRDQQGLRGGAHRGAGGQLLGGKHYYKRRALLRGGRRGTDQQLPQAAGFLHPLRGLSTSCSAGTSTQDSRLMFRRTLSDRIKTVAPFLTLDADPYLVVDDAGQLVWIQDAYTTSDLYPYSEYNGGLNYIRNSVKITVSAYDGKMTFYMVDPTDPVVQTYAKIFPDLFTPFEEMPEDIQRHLRYPEGLFNTQMDMFKTYHMNEVEAFYQKEDVWDLPTQTYGIESKSLPLSAFYVILKLPEEEQGRAGVDAALQPEGQGQHGRLDGGPLRRSQLWEAHKLFIPGEQAGPGNSAVRVAGRPAADHVRTDLPCGTRPAHA